MSRTKRNSPKAHHNTFSSGRYCYELTHLDNCYGKWVYQSLDKGGWKEAKRLLSDGDYNYLRKQQGDCFSKRMKHLSTPKHYRKQVEKCNRRFGNKEIHQFMLNSEYEVNNDERYRMMDGWVWF